MSCAGARPCSVTARTVTKQASPAHATICLQRPLQHVPRNIAAKRQRSRTQRSVGVQAGLLSMFLSTKQNTSANADLVNELLELASNTAGGAAASTDQRERISQLVGVRRFVYFKAIPQSAVYTACICQCRLSDFNQRVGSGTLVTAICSMASTRCVCRNLLLPVHAWNDPEAAGAASPNTSQSRWTQQSTHFPPEPFVLVLTSICNSQQGLLGCCMCPTSRMKAQNTYTSVSSYRTVNSVAKQKFL